MENASPESGKESQKCSNSGEDSTLSKANNVIFSSKIEQCLGAKINNFMMDRSESDYEDDPEVDYLKLELGDLSDYDFEALKIFLLRERVGGNVVQKPEPITTASLEAVLEATGCRRLSKTGEKPWANLEVKTPPVDEAAAALSRMQLKRAKSALLEACNGGDVSKVKQLIEEGLNVNEMTDEGDSLLSLVCQAGYYELAQVLLAVRANVEYRGIKDDCTPLMETASAGHIDIVKLLINHGADVNAKSSTGNTPLMYACAGGHSAVVNFLLDSGANVEDRNENGHTPLMESASAGHVNVAKILLSRGVSVNTHSSEFSESALTLACFKGQLEMVRFLLEAGADMKQKTDEMHTPLMEACVDGHVDVARLLLDSGAQLNMLAGSFQSPLTVASANGHVELGLLLVERGANIEEVNDQGYTPLMEAAQGDHEEMVALLLSQGAELNAQTDDTQETALTGACGSGSLGLVDFLIKAGADIELGAMTPLMEASQTGQLEIVKYLLHANANVHARTKAGDTALTYACGSGNTDVAEVLLRAGAKLEHVSDNGQTPLMKAAKQGHLQTVQFLIRRNANVNRQTTNNDHTPLSLACAGGHLEVVKCLMSHSADHRHTLKDNSNMLIEASKGRHATVLKYLLDYPNNTESTSKKSERFQLSLPAFKALYKILRADIY